jgi:hypothetical protein
MKPPRYPNIDTLRRRVVGNRPCDRKRRAVLARQLARWHLWKAEQHVRRAETAEAYAERQLA